MTDDSTSPTDDSGEPAGAPSLRERELEIAREIAHAFLTATRPLEVYRLALARVTPLVGASFSSVFLRDPEDPSLLKLACAQNWPQASARYLGQLRIRVGRGPTGRAVAEGSAVEVENVFDDPAQKEWWEPAQELGFASLVTLPLRTDGRVVGALSFYFDGPHRFDERERSLLSLVTAQLAATSERAQLIEDLRSANAALTQQNAELEQRVREAEKARQLKTEFLANMSHELRTPLTSILGYAYILRELQAGPLTERQQTAVEKIDRSATVLLRLINDLLELSRLKLGRSAVRVGSVDAGEVARVAAEQAGEARGDVAFRIEASEPALTLETDGEKVVKVLENLISNAFKFTARGEVVVRVRRMAQAPTWIEWAVRDTGIGIAEEDRATLFDEFRQVDGSSTRLYGGTGLGLALSRQLAHVLGGEIGVTSEPGVGSVFTLRLPEKPAPEGP